MGYGLLAISYLFIKKAPVVQWKGQKIADLQIVVRFHAGAPDKYLLYAFTDQTN